MIFLKVKVKYKLMIKKNRQIMTLKKIKTIKTY